MAEQDNNHVIIEDAPQAQEQQKESIDFSDLLPKEIEMAKKHNLIPEKEGGGDGKHKELSETTEKSDSQREGEKATERKEKIDPATFEEMEDEEKTDLESFHQKYSRNAKGLYNRYKKERLARQETAERLENLRAQQDLSDLRVKSSNDRLVKIKNILAGDPESITVEAIQSALGNVEDKAEPTDDDQPVTKAELKRMAEDSAKKRAEEAERQRERNNKIVAVEAAGKTKYKDFDALVERANKVVNEDKRGHFSNLLNSAIDDDSTTEEEIVDLVVKIASLSPGASAGRQEDVDRMVKNANKQKTSAAITGGGGGRRAVSFDDLTVEDAVKLSPEQWRKVPENIRRRLLGG